MIDCGIGVFGRWIIDDFLNDVVDLIQNFSSAHWYMALEFSGTDLVDDTMSFDWAFTNATVWRTAFTFTVIPTWIVELSIIFFGIFPIKINFLHLDWVNLPSAIKITIIMLDNGLI